MKNNFKVGDRFYTGLISAYLNRPLVGTIVSISGNQTDIFWDNGAGVDANNNTAYLNDLFKDGHWKLAPEPNDILRDLL